MRVPVLLMLLSLPLAGCDKLTGAAEQKIADAEAIGFACRVSGKAPEACMKENEAQSPSSILDGWKSADEDIRSGKLDPGMSMAASHRVDVAAAEGDNRPEDGKGEAGGEEGKDDAPKPQAREAKPAEKKAPAPH